MNELMTGKMAILILMCVLGLLTHWLKQFIQVRKADGTMINFETYWITYWPETTVALISAMAGFVFLHELGQLSSINAFGIGYIANSIADIIGSRVQALVAGAPNGGNNAPQ